MSSHKILLLPFRPKKPEADKRRVLYKFTADRHAGVGVSLVRRLEDEEDANDAAAEFMEEGGSGPVMTYGWCRWDSWEALQ